MEGIPVNILVVICGIVVRLLLLLAGDVELNPGPPGNIPSQQQPSSQRSHGLRVSELLELSKQLNADEATALMINICPAWDRQRDAVRSQDGRFSLLTDWYQNFGRPSRSREMLSEQLGRAGRQDLVEQLKSNKILHLTYCREKLAQRYDRLLEEERWQNDSYITQRLSKTSDIGARTLDDPCELLGVTGQSTLIEGAIGFGKTMLTRRLLAEWTRRYRRGDSPPLLFLLPSDQIRNEDTLESAIYREVLDRCEGVNEMELANQIAEDPSSVIVIIDSAADMQSFCKTQVCRHLLKWSKEMGDQFTLNVTSRPDTGFQFPFDFTVQIGLFTGEDVDEFVDKSFRNNEEAGWLLREFLKENKNIRDDICSIPLLCGVMCRFWKLCKNNNEIDQITKFDTLADFSDKLVERLFHDNITGIRSTVAPTPLFNFRARFEDRRYSHCGGYPAFDLYGTMKELGQVAFSKLRRRPYSFQESDFLHCSKSFKIACITRVLERRGNTIEFFHPIIQARFVVAYLVKVHRSSTLKFQKALSELDARNTPYSDWVYIFAAGSRSSSMARDVLQHLASKRPTHNLLCECVVQATDSSSTPNTSSDNAVLSWPQCIVLKEPTSIAVLGLLLALRYVKDIENVTIDSMADFTFDGVYLFQLLTEVAVRLGSLAFIRCDFSQEIILVLLGLFSSSSLKILDLSDSTATSDFMDELSKLLADLKGLLTLRLPNVVQYPCELLSTLPEKCPVLHELKLSFEGPCCHEGQCQMCQNRFNHLESLSIKCGNVDASRHGVHLAKLISSAFAIDKLFIQCESMSTDFLASLRSLEHVDKLQLEVTVLDALILPDLFSKVPGLCRFVLRYGSINEMDILTVFQSLTLITGLRSLDMKYLGAQDVDRPSQSPAMLEDIPEILQKYPNLESLVISDTPLHNRVTLYILNVVIERRTSLHRLRLVRCSTDDSQPCQTKCDQIRNMGRNVDIVHGLPHYVTQRKNEPMTLVGPETLSGALPAGTTDNPSEPALAAGAVGRGRSSPCGHTSISAVGRQIHQAHPEEGNSVNSQRCLESEQLLDVPSHQPMLSTKLPSRRGCLHSLRSDTSEQAAHASSTGLIPVRELLPHSLRNTLCLLLNIRTLSGNDWQALAEEFHLDDFRMSLGLKQNPAKELFGLAVERGSFTSLDQLIDVFERMDRADCAGKVREYIRQQSH